MSTGTLAAVLSLKEGHLVSQVLKSQEKLERDVQGAQCMHKEDAWYTVYAFSMLPNRPLSSDSRSACATHTFQDRGLNLVLVQHPLTGARPTAVSGMQALRALAWFVARRCSSMSGARRSLDNNRPIFASTRSC